MGLVKVVPAVHLALEAGLLPGGVVGAVLRRGHPLHGADMLGEHKRLEDRPGSATKEGGFRPGEREAESQGHTCHTQTEGEIVNPV